jgi:hypothetical protein
MTTTTTTATSATNSQDKNETLHHYSNVDTKNNPPNNTKQINLSSLTPNDVLLGRGGGTNRHNIHFRLLVSSFQPQYVQSRKKQKTEIAKTILSIVRQNQGRFLKLQENGMYYLEVEDKVAMVKTSQALREGLSGRMREIVKTGMTK